MAHSPDLNQLTEIAVLPKRQGSPPRHLDAAAALELALYGATACRMTPLFRLIDTVWCLTGGGWRPPQEVIAEGLRAASASGTILATESWVRSIPFFYTLTPKGAKAFQQLMRRPLPDWDDPITRSSAAVKFGLLDTADTKDLPAVVADLQRFYRDARAGLCDRQKGMSPDRPFLQVAMTDRISWIDRRLHALEGCNNSLSPFRVVH